MENPMGFAHFLSNADGIARFVLALLLASVGTWYLIVTKNVQVFRMRRKSESFLSTGIKTSPMLTDARATSEKVIAMARAQVLAGFDTPPTAHPGLALR